MSTKRRASNDASLIATTPSTDAIAWSVSVSKLTPARAGCSWKRIMRQADVGDGLVIGDRDARVERLAQVGRDREHEQRVGAGGPEVASLAHGRIGGRAGQPRDDRDVRHVADDLEDADLLVVGQVRPLAGVDVDREGDGSLGRRPSRCRSAGPAHRCHRPRPSAGRWRGSGRRGSASWRAPWGRRGRDQ